MNNTAQFPEWESFVKQRLNELHGDVFGETTDNVSTAAYFAYHKELNLKFNMGRDLSEHPRNPFKKI